MLTMPLWNIRNKLCEATTKFSLARNVEERHEFWIEEVPHCFSRSSVKFEGRTAKKNRRFWPKLGVSGL